LFWQGVCASCHDPDSDVATPGGATGAKSPASAGAGHVVKNERAKAATEKASDMPVIVISKRKMREDYVDDAPALMQACVDHMKHKLRDNLIGMYGFLDMKDEKCMHDVMIFKDSDAVLDWADNLVAWPATRAGRPILEWVECLEREETGEWWTGVVLGGHTADTQDRLRKMGANLKYLKSAPGQGFVKQKIKVGKLKGKPVVVYKIRKLKVHAAPNPCMRACLSLPSLSSSLRC